MFCCLVQRSVLKALKKAFLSELWSAVRDGDVEVLTGLQVDVLSNLIRLAAANSDLTRLMNDLPAVLQKPDSNERYTYHLFGHIELGSIAKPGCI